ncbi:MAG: IPT/TIG domain-containing protein, partial [Candidatus Poseidoniaceae archaeon]|nr:IPT/TIG domain-containing protein [Candidatus Poseidoniaceae archaeon]
MRTWFVVVVLLSVIASPILTKTPILEDLDDDIQHSSPIQAIISPSSGWTTGGDEITITGSGFLDMAWKNLTSDGNAYTWTTTTASYVYYSGWDPSIGVDSNGTVHIAHSNMDSDDFWLSSYDGSTWAHLKIRNCGMCSNADLVIDSNDNIHIAYYHDISGTGYLLYTMYDGTSWSNNWSTSTAENDQISITLDANDRPHISYSRDGYICNAALLTYYDGSSWITITLDDTTTYVGCDSSIAIDSNGFVHVAYRHHGNMDMKIASNISGSWQRYLVDNGNGVGYRSAMAVDSNDDLHLVYSSNAAGNAAYFADGASGSAWTVSNQGSSRNSFSMYIDQFDIVHISEYNGNSNLGYSMMAPGDTRQSMTIDNTGNVGYENDIVVDDNNMVHIAYFDSTNKNLKYANRSTGMYLNHEITVQFGTYGSVTGTVVNDTTIRVTTPSAGSVAEQVDLKLFGDQGSSLDLGLAFQYVSPDDVDM